MTDVSATASGRERRDQMFELTGEPRRDPLLQKDAYISPEFFGLERERLWPRVWQVACREEEIPNVGDFVEYEITDESIVVVRSAPDQIRAFYNVCQHRGKRLVRGVGAVRKFRCAYHGWTYGLDGECTTIVDEQDYVTLCKGDVALKQVRCETWQGYVFINMDMDAEPLLSYLAPVPEYLDPFDIGKMRIRWWKTVVMPANWKTLMDPFVETYHVQCAHPQMLPYYDDASLTFRRGKHGQVSVPPDAKGIGVPSPRLGIGERRDPRKLVQGFFEAVKRDVDTVWTWRDLKAAEGLLQLPEDLSPAEVFMTYFATLKEIAEADGSGERRATLESVMRAGVDWHIFPNHFTLPTLDGALAYRVRPNGLQVESAILDVWALERFAPGAEPPLEREFYTDWRDGNFPTLFQQDFAYIEDVQKGMHSRGLSVLRPNPLQESTIANYHDVIRQYLFG